MAHGLENPNDMFYVGETPWHALGTKLNKPPTTEEALIQANLNWRVWKDETELPGFQVKTGYYTTYRCIEETGEPIILGNVSAKYEILQNKDAFKPFDEVLLDYGYQYETAGMIHNGKRIWILAKAPTGAVVGDDIVNKYALLFNSHDGSTAVTLKPTPVRVVCNNTLNLALSKGAGIKLKHTSGVKDRLDEATNVLRTAEGSFTKAIEHMNRMTDLKNFDIIAYFESIMPKLKERGKQEFNVVTGRKAPDRQQPIFDALLTNYYHGRGNSGQTVWDAYNAVTEWVDHGKYNKDDNWINRTQFGHGNQVKLTAYKEAVKLTENTTNFGYEPSVN
jgi:phage/plasmid-like protein (TIGR03299 family)